jgi:hypothetical protein
VEVQFHSFLTVGFTPGGIRHPHPFEWGLIGPQNRYKPCNEEKNVRCRRSKVNSGALMTILTPQLTHSTHYCAKTNSKQIPCCEIGHNIAHVQIINSRFCVIYNWNSISVELLHFGNSTHRMRF